MYIVYDRMLKYHTNIYQLENFIYIVGMQYV